MNQTTADRWDFLFQTFSLHSVLFDYLMDKILCEMLLNVFRRWLISLRVENWLFWKCLMIKYFLWTSSSQVTIDQALASELLKDVDHMVDMSCVFWLSLVLMSHLSSWFIQLLYRSWHVSCQGHRTTSQKQQTFISSSKLIKTSLRLSQWHCLDSENRFNLTN